MFDSHSWSFITNLVLNSERYVLSHSPLSCPGAIGWCGRSLLYWGSIDWFRWWATCSGPIVTGSGVFHEQMFKALHQNIVDCQGWFYFLGHRNDVRLKLDQRSLLNTSLRTCWLIPSGAFAFWWHAWKLSITVYTTNELGIFATLCRSSQRKRHLCTWYFIQSVFSLTRFRCTEGDKLPHRLSWYSGKLTGIVPHHIFTCNHSNRGKMSMWSSFIENCIFVPL